MGGRSVRGVRGVPVVVTAGLAATVLLGGCGSSGGGSTSTTSAAAPAPSSQPGAAPSSQPGAAGSTQPGAASTQPGGAAAPGATGGSGSAAAGQLTVTIKDLAFDPGTLQARVGQTVTVTNQDSVPHDWTDKGGAFKSSMLDPGQSFTYTFQKAGTYNVYCTIHPFMQQTVVVS